MPAPYLPKTVGPVESARITDALEIQIEPDRDEAYIGDPIRFEVTIRNVSDGAFWVPRDPDLLFTWTYADGGRDNYVDEFANERFYTFDQVVLLKPGESMVKHFDIKTYYFDTAGITEFRALVQTARNTNPAINPFWQGRAMSNAYGVVVKDARRRPYPGGSSAAYHVPRRPTS